MFRILLIALLGIQATDAEVIWKCACMGKSLNASTVLTWARNLVSGNVQKINLFINNPNNVAAFYNGLPALVRHGYDDHASNGPPLIVGLSKLINLRFQALGFTYVFHQMRQTILDNNATLVLAYYMKKLDQKLMLAPTTRENIMAKNELDALRLQLPSVPIALAFGQMVSLRPKSAQDGTLQSVRNLIVVSFLADNASNWFVDRDESGLAFRFRNADYGRAVNTDKTAKVFGEASSANKLQQWMPIVDFNDDEWYHLKHKETGRFLLYSESSDDELSSQPEWDYNDDGYLWKIKAVYIN